MTFEQFIAVVQDWQSRLTPEEARRRIEGISRMGIVGWPRGMGISVEAVLAMAARGEPAPLADGKADGIPPASSAQAGKRGDNGGASGDAASAEQTKEAADEGRIRNNQNRSSSPLKKAETGAPDRVPEWIAEREAQLTGKRARALVREQLKYGPRPGAQIEAAAEAAAIPKPVLLAATDELGVRTKRGEWRLPR